MRSSTSVKEWFEVPRDLETISRSLQRKIFGLDSRSSFPMLSGDTFKYLCDYIIEGQIEEGDHNFFALQSLRGRIFVQAKPLSNAAGYAAGYLVQACLNGFTFKDAELIIHNGDVIPASNEMAILSRSFKKVYSVNWLGDHTVASPLPIGLENRDKRRNGVPSDYQKAQKRGLPSEAQRDIPLLVCFSLHTNLKERTEALNFARKVARVKIVTDPITPKQYRELVLRSRFVLSPPGNGPDCHRTWEALYLGATPIVIRSSWPFVDQSVPALVIDSWENLADEIRNFKTEKEGSWADVENWLPS
jgi:hypothetical protein